jgi:hypothetical protein
MTIMIIIAAVIALIPRTSFSVLESSQLTYWWLIVVEISPVCINKEFGLAINPYCGLLGEMRIMHLEILEI